MKKTSIRSSSKSYSKKRLQENREAKDIAIELSMLSGYCSDNINMLYYKFIEHSDLMQKLLNSGSDKTVELELSVMSFEDWFNSTGEEL